MKKFQRQLIQWRESVRAAWRRLSMFHRIAFGIMVSIMVVWGTREYVLDRLQTELAALNATLAEQEAPLAVPVPEEDNDVQESMQILENLTAGLDRVKADEAKVLQERPPLDPRRKNEGITAMAGLISESGLRMIGVEELEPNLSGPLPTSEHLFTVAGSFPAIYSFFKRASAFQYPCRIHGLALELSEDPGSARLSGSGAVLTLMFQLRLFYHDE